jgi:hypothetical protein
MKKVRTVLVTGNRERETVVKGRRRMKLPLDTALRSVLVFPP